MVTKKQQFDYGLAILRMIMCFMVVLCHFWDATDASGVMRIFSYMRGYAVPVFMTMSFVFSQKFLIQHEKQKVIDRFERLLIPQIGWAIIYWGVYIVIDHIIGLGLQPSISDMFWQIFTGHSAKLNVTMWYQVVLIYLTLLFLLIIILFKNKNEWVLCVFAVAAVAIQYSGINMVFSSLRYELSYPIGRFFEMVPLAVAGYLLSSKNVLEKVKAYRLPSIICSVVVIAIAILCGKFINPSGYGYQGIQEVLMGVALVSLFCAIPFERMNETNKKIVKIVTSYTMGIYCMHRLVGTLMNIALPHLGISVYNPNSFVGCVLIYVLSFIASWIGFKALKKTKLKSLFN